MSRPCETQRCFAFIIDLYEAERSCCTACQVLIVLEAWQVCVSPCQHGSRGSMFIAILGPLHALVRGRCSSNIMLQSGGVATSSISALVARKTSLVLQEVVFQPLVWLL